MKAFCGIAAFIFLTAIITVNDAIEPPERLVEPEARAFLQEALSQPISLAAKQACRVLRNYFKEKIVRMPNRYEKPSINTMAIFLKLLEFDMTPHDALPRLQKCLSTAEDEWDEDFSETPCIIVLKIDKCIEPVPEPASRESFVYIETLLKKTESNPRANAQCKQAAELSRQGLLEMDSESSRLIFKREVLFEILMAENIITDNQKGPITTCILDKESANLAVVTNKFPCQAVEAYESCFPKSAISQSEAILTDFFNKVFGRSLVDQENIKCVHLRELVRTRVVSVIDSGKPDILKHYLAATNAQEQHTTAGALYGIIKCLSKLTSQEFFNTQIATSSSSPCEFMDSIQQCQKDANKPQTDNDARYAKVWKKIANSSRIAPTEKQLCIRLRHFYLQHGFVKIKKNQYEIDGETLKYLFMTENAPVQSCIDKLEKTVSLDTDTPCQFTKALDDCLENSLDSVSDNFQLLSKLMSKEKFSYEERVDCFYFSLLVKNGVVTFNSKGIPYINIPLLFSMLLEKHLITLPDKARFEADVKRLYELYPFRPDFPCRFVFLVDYMLRTSFSPRNKRSGYLPRAISGGDMTSIFKLF